MHRGVQLTREILIDSEGRQHFLDKIVEIGLDGETHDRAVTTGQFKALALRVQEFGNVIELPHIRYCEGDEHE